MEISEGVIRLGDNTLLLLDLHNSSYDTQPHSLIVKYANFSQNYLYSVANLH